MEFRCETFENSNQNVFAAIFSAIRDGLTFANLSVPSFPLETGFRPRDSQMFFVALPETLSPGLRWRGLRSRSGDRVLPGRGMVSSLFHVGVKVRQR